MRRGGGKESMNVKGKSRQAGKQAGRSGSHESKKDEVNELGRGEIVFVLALICQFGREERVCVCFSPAV